MAADGSLMELDQAIFTSVESIMSQGYRVVAQTPRITAEEKKTIATSSPSHGSLCDKSDDAVAVSFYPLPTGRFCVARTGYAGQEQTGRGGRRVLTRAFVLDREQMGAFAWNPFSVLRTLEESRALDIPDRPPDTLEPVSVRARRGDHAAALTTGFDAVGETPFLYLLDRLIGDACLIVAGLDNAAALTEGLLMAVPRSLRARFDFSIGMRFAIGRRHRLNWVETDPKSTKRIIRGQKIDLLEKLEEGKVPRFQMGRWSEMVADCRATSNVVQLAQLAEDEFDDDSTEVLDRVASRQIDLNHVCERSIEELFETLLLDVDSETTLIEQRVEQRYRRAARDCLLGRLSRLPHEELTPFQEALSALAESDSDFESLLLRLSEGSEEDPGDGHPVGSDNDFVRIIDRPG